LRKIAKTAGMSLAGQTCWIVGGVGVIGRGITRGLLQAGATVLVNSRSPGRLEKLRSELGYPERLITVHGSLLPGYASKTVSQTLQSIPIINHVVAHGAVRWWAAHAACDETYSLNIRGSGRLLDMTHEDFACAGAQLASLHFSAAQELVPRVQASGGRPTYTFVTGDGSGKPGGKRTAMGDINSHHVWGLSAALRNELSSPSGSNGMVCRDLRIGIPINRSNEEKVVASRKRPLSEDIGDLCASMAAGTSHDEDNGKLISINDEEKLQSLLNHYGGVFIDSHVGALPTNWELNGSL